MKSRRSERVQARLRRSSRQYYKNTLQEPSHFMDKADIQLRHELRETMDEGSFDMDAPLATVPQGPLDALRSAMASGEFSDLRIICDGQTFKIHRLIVCSQSPVLAAFCTESEFSGQIELNTDNIEAVTKMIEFLYTGTYTSIDTGPSFSLFIHTKMHGIGLKYNIHTLVNFSAINFARALRRVRDLEVYFQSICEVYSQPLAYPHVRNRDQLSIPTAPPELQGNNHGHELRAEVIEAALVELGKILSSPPVMARFLQVCTSIPQFHADFLWEMVWQMESRWRHSATAVDRGRKVMRLKLGVRAVGAIACMSSTDVESLGWGEEEESRKCKGCSKSVKWNVSVKT